MKNIKATEMKIRLAEEHLKASERLIEQVSETGKLVREIYTEHLFDNRSIRKLANESLVFMKNEFSVLTKAISGLKKDLKLLHTALELAHADYKNRVWKADKEQVEKHNKRGNNETHTAKA